MAVWCGQCQTRNEGHPDFCIACGALLRPAADTTARSAPSRRPAADGRPSSYQPFRYDNKTLQQLTLACFPGRPDLAKAAGECRFALRRELASSGLGERVFFFPDRVGGCDCEEFSARQGASSLTLGVVRDSAGAICWVERALVLGDAPVEARLFQLEQLARDRRLANLLQVISQAFCVALAVLLLLALPSSLWPQAYAPFFATVSIGLAALARFQARRLSALAEIDRLTVALSQSLSLPSVMRPAGEPQSQRRMSLVAPVATCLLFLWLAVHSIAWPGAPVSATESVIVVLVVIFGYPVVAALDAGRDWLALRALRAESSDGTATATRHGIARPIS